MLNKKRVAKLLLKQQRAAIQDTKEGGAKIELDKALKLQEQQYTAFFPGQAQDKQSHIISSCATMKSFLSSEDKENKRPLNQIHLKKQRLLSPRKSAVKPYAQIQVPS